MFSCLQACTLSDEAAEVDAPVANPRPEWCWPARKGTAFRVMHVLGMRRTMEVWLSIEVDRLKWYTNDETPQLIGVIDLACANVHGDVSRLNGKPSPVLDIEASGSTKKLVLEFGALELMHEWWCALATAQHLSRRLHYERGEPGGDWDEEEMGRSSSTSTRSGERQQPLKTRIVDVSQASTVRKAYEQVLRMIIRPPRARYPLSKLGPSRFMYGDGVVTREDFSVVNERGLRVEASIWRDARRSKAPTLIYLHGNASCRLEGLTALTLCLSIGASLCAIDCSGSGASEGDYVSLGLYESADVYAVAQYLQYALGVPRYALWGRSMGSVTALLYASGKSPDASCIIVDSPFASLKQLCTDLVRKVSLKIPSPVLAMALRQIRSSVKYRALFDINEVHPERRVVSCVAPAIFIHGASDDFIAPSHSEAIVAAYGGQTKRLLKPEGGHNATRPTEVFATIEAFLKEHLLVDDFVDDPTRPSPSLAHLDATIQNPYLVPPWAYKNGDPRRGLDERFLTHAKAQAAKVRRSADHTPHDDDDDDDDEEFISGMSDSRHKEVEGGIGAFFGVTSPRSPRSPR